MLQRTSLPGSIVFHASRLLPCIASFFVGGAVLPATPEAANAILGAAILLVLTVGVWSLAEGTVLLWHRAKLAGKREHRGYAVVIYLIGMVFLVLLQLFRTRSSSTQFLLLLFSCAVRGMARASWDQHRPYIAFPASLIANTLLGVLSFEVFGSDIHWQTIIYALAFGAAASSVEAAWYEEVWYGETWLTEDGSRWLRSAFRVLVVAGPVLIASLAFARQLPTVYVCTYLALPWALKNARKTVQSNAGNALFSPVAGVYLIFMAIMLGCRWII